MLSSGGSPAPRESPWWCRTLPAPWTVPHSGPLVGCLRASLWFLWGGFCFDKAALLLTSLPPVLNFPLKVAPSPVLCIHHLSGSWSQSKRTWKEARLLATCQPGILSPSLTSRRGRGLGGVLDPSLVPPDLDLPQEILMNSGDTQQGYRRGNREGRGSGER